MNSNEIPRFGTPINLEVYVSQAIGHAQVPSAAVGRPNPAAAVGKPPTVPSAATSRSLGIASLRCRQIFLIVFLRLSLKRLQ